MNLFSTLNINIFVALGAATVSNAFVIRPPAPVLTKLNLEGWIADLIDSESHRQEHKEEYEREWMEKNRAAVFNNVESDFGPIDDFDQTNFREHNKDKKLALDNPEKYCADRCIATGNCDIYEDFYKMGPEDVIKFCTECVLSEDGECEIPNGFYDNTTLTP